MSGNSNGKKKKRDWALFFLILWIVSFVISVGSGLFVWHECSRLKASVQDYQESISELEDTINGLTIDGNSEKEIIIQYPENEVISGSESINFADAVAILQNQIIGYSDNINYMLAILSIVLTVVTIAIPLLNYGFFQKVHIDRIDELADGLEEEEEKRQFDFESIKKEMEQRVVDLQKNYDDDREKYLELIHTLECDLSDIDLRMQRNENRLNKIAPQHNDVTHGEDKMGFSDDESNIANIDMLTSSTNGNNDLEDY